MDIEFIRTDIERRRRPLHYGRTPSDGFCCSGERSCRIRYAVIVSDQTGRREYASESKRSAGAVECAW
jgi:hypothetical protein